MRKLFAGVAGCSLALVLGGCVVFTGPTLVVQQDVIGKMRVMFSICPSEIPESPDGMENTDDSHNGCPDHGNSGDAPGDTTPNDDFQVFLGFRVPVGTEGPASFSALASSTLSDTLTFSSSTRYTRALTESVPPPAGFEWLGYISAPYAHNDGPDNTPAQRANFAVDFQLPPAVDGTPFAGPFRIRPVVGGRIAGSNPERIVSCGDNPFAQSGNNGGPFGGSSVCIDSPDPATAATNLSFASSDLGVAGGAATASPGQTVQLPFNANLNGTLPANTTFSVAATSTMPGVTVAPSPASFTPAANSSTRITVPVAIPRNAGPGTFDVSVTASLPNGQTRTGTSKLTVRDRQLPVASRLSIRPRTLSPQAPSIAAPARVSYRLSEAATMRFRVQRCRKVRRKGRRTRTRCRTLRGSFTHAGKAGTNRLRFTGFLRNRALKRGSYRLVGTPTDPAGNKGKSVRASFRIKR